MKGWMIYVLCIICLASWERTNPVINSNIGNGNLERAQTNKAVYMGDKRPTSRGQAVHSSRDSRRREVSRIFTMTAYTHTGHKTASGTWPKAGRTIAVNPKVIPLDSEFEAKKHGRKSLEIRR